MGPPGRLRCGSRVPVRPWECPRRRWNPIPRTIRREKRSPKRGRIRSGWSGADGGAGRKPNPPSLSTSSKPVNSKRSRRKPALCKVNSLKKIWTRSKSADMRSELLEAFSASEQGTAPCRATPPACRPYRAALPPSIPHPPLPATPPLRRWCGDLQSVWSPGWRRRGPGPDDPRGNGGGVWSGVTRLGVNESGGRCTWRAEKKLSCTWGDFLEISHVEMVWR